MWQTIRGLLIERGDDLAYSTLDGGRIEVTFAGFFETTAAVRVTTEKKEGYADSKICKGIPTELAVGDRLFFVMFKLSS